MTVLFWTSLVLVIYTYLGYPLIIWVLAKAGPRDIRRQGIRPSVSIIIAARNEADKIRQKIENTLALDYPVDRVEIIVASDASDDETDEIVNEYASQRVRLVRSPQRGGKECVQGLAVAVAKGEILIFTDAAAMLDPDAARRLVENFGDSTIGAVSTEDLIVDLAGTPTAEGIYVKYEMWVRRLESRFHSLVGLSGSCFAIRKELCTDWSASLQSDFMGGLRAARSEFRSIADPSVRAKFPTVISAPLEMPRRVRTFLRGITVLMANLDMVNPFRFGRFAFQLASHKLLRFIAPFLLLTILVTSGILTDEQPFRLFFWAQVGFYGLGAIGGVVPMLQKNWIIRVAHYFTMVQCAMAIAWSKYLRGDQQIAWEPSKRPRIVASDRGSHH